MIDTTFSDVDLYPNVLFKQNFAKFWSQKNMILTYAKDFLWKKKGSKSLNFGEKKLQITRFLSYVPISSQEYKKIMVLFYFHM